MSMMRFVLFGAVAFGIGVAMGASLILPLGILLGGVVGEAALGLAVKDFRRAETRTFESSPDWRQLPHSGVHKD